MRTHLHTARIVVRISDNDFYQLNSHLSDRYPQYILQTRVWVHAPQNLKQYCTASMVDRIGDPSYQQDSLNLLPEGLTFVRGILSER